MNNQKQIFEINLHKWQKYNLGFISKNLMMN